MALSANIVWEVRTAGLNTNGGGFVSGATGVDYSQQDSKRNGLGSNDSTTDVVASGLNDITSATANFTANIVGNVIYLQGGTGLLAAGWYWVIAFVNSTTISLDRPVASGTGITMNIGGALLSPALAASLSVAGNSIWVKSGTYSITSASFNVVGGCIQLTSQTSLQGYNTSRFDYSTRPLLQASGISTFTMVDFPNDATVNNLELDGASLTSSRGITTSSRCRIFRCLLRNFTNTAISANGGSITRCTATGCTGGSAAFVASGGGIFQGCVAYSNTITGFSLNVVGSAAIDCLSLNNSGSTSDGFHLSGNTAGPCVNCTAYGNGRDGFRLTGSATIVINTISEANSGYGYFNDISIPTGSLIGFAGYGNTSGLKNSSFQIEVDPIIGLASFFTNPGSGDFSLNNNVGGGALLRGTAYPGALVYGGTGYLDYGALQHQESASGGAVPGRRSIVRRPRRRTKHS